MATLDNMGLDVGDAIVAPKIGSSAVLKRATRSKHEVESLLAQSVSAAVIDKATKRNQTKLFASINGSGIFFFQPIKECSKISHDYFLPSPYAAMIEEIPSGVGCLTTQRYLCLCAQYSLGVKGEVVSYDSTHKKRPDGLSKHGSFVNPQGATYNTK